MFEAIREVSGGRFGGVWRSFERNKHQKPATNKLRKDIKNIKLNITYDLSSNEIVFKNIKIDDNKVSDQFYNIAEGFNDNNSNNLTKSRRLLNKLIGLYEG